MSANERFGDALRHQREMAGWTLDRLAREAGISRGQIGNMERGARRPSPKMLAQLDGVSELGGPRWARLWDELTGSGRRAWREEIAEHMRTAISIMDWQLSLWPGLLQSEPYARWVITSGSPWARSGQLDSPISERVQRAERFAQSDSPLLWCVIDELIITRGGMPKDVRSAQLGHVAELVRTDRVSIQVLPADTPDHCGLGGSFKVIQPRGGGPIVYAESVHEGQIVDTPDAVAEYQLLFGRLQAVAMPPDASAQLIRDEADKAR